MTSIDPKWPQLTPNDLIFEKFEKKKFLEKKNKKIFLIFFNVVFLYFFSVLYSLFIYFKQDKHS